jgi:hypothetical protein
MGRDIGSAKSVFRLGDLGIGLHKAESVSRCCGTSSMFCCPEGTLHIRKPCPNGALFLRRLLKTAHRVNGFDLLAFVLAEGRCL